MQLKNIRLEEIDYGKRYREDFGEIEELARDIGENGLICPIAVYSSNGEAPFRLLAGGRRFFAHAHLGYATIAANVYDHELTELEMRVIELSENVKRKELDFLEKANLMDEIHRLQVELHGEKTSTSGDEGWSQRDTAKMLKVSPATITQDLKIAKLGKEAPDLELSKCKDRKEALKKIETAETVLLRSALAERAEKELQNEEDPRPGAYVLGDFFTASADHPDGFYDICEIDPPYAIDLPEIKRAETSYDAVYGTSYNEVSSDSYPAFLAATLSRCYDKMSPNSWLIVWFAPHPWWQFVVEAIRSCGFKMRAMPAIWAKPSGQTQAPKRHLSSNTEYFFYARKGEPEIKKPGRSNIYSYSTVPVAEKVHPTERPLDLIEDILSTFGFENSRVLVPFAGSGKTLRAAFNLKMLPVGFDLSQEYRDAYIARLIGEKENLYGER